MEHTIIALVSYPFLPARNGGQRAIALFYQYFSKYCPVLCITTRSSEPAYAAGYRVQNILSASAIRYMNLFYFFLLRKKIKQEGATHLIIEHPYYGWLGILLQFFCGIKLIVRSHNIESLRFKSIGKWWWKILWWYERFVHRQAHLNFFITDEDRNFAIEKFQLKASACTTITYGFEATSPPAANEQKAARQQLQQLYDVNEATVILLFNGMLDYKPNLDAVDRILHYINPLLLGKKGLDYKIIICGKNLPATYNNLLEYTNRNIIYAGFVADISLYFTGADVFINPVTDGGGIKTKLIEALGSNLSCVSTISGAAGIPVSVTGQKMLLADDNNWEEFTEKIGQIDPAIHTPDSFFDHFYWGNVVKKAVTLIEKDWSAKL